MAVNDLTFTQAATVLNSIVKQATGQTAQLPTNTAEFVSVAQTALKAGYDPVLNAISQVLSRTIFSIRPYNRKFAGLQVDNQKFGNITVNLILLIRIGTMMPALNLWTVRAWTCSRSINPTSFRLISMALTSMKDPTLFSGISLTMLFPARKNLCAS